MNICGTDTKLEQFRYVRPSNLIYSCVYLLYLALLGSQVLGACFSMSRPGRLFITYY